MFAATILSGCQTDAIDTQDLGAEIMIQLTEVTDFQPRRLTLTGNPITDDSAKQLAESAILDRLQCLFMSRTQISDLGVAALCSSCARRKS